MILVRPEEFINYLFFLSSIFLNTKVFIIINNKGGIGISRRNNQLKENLKVSNTKKRQNNNYLNKTGLKRKMANSEVFTNIKEINDECLITLKSNQYAVFYKVNGIDLTLTNDREQSLFFNMLSQLYRLNFTIKAYKFDEKINLNVNKEYYDQLIENNDNNKAKLAILNSNKNFIDVIEDYNMTYASSYYFAIIGESKEALEKHMVDFERHCDSIVPKLIIEKIINKKWLVKILTKMYFSSANLDQIIYYDFIDLISPMHLIEKPSFLKVDDEEIQLLTIKNYPLFLEGDFLDRIVNLNNVNVSITINETIEQSKLLSILNSSFKAVLADFNSSKNLSDVTEMSSLMSNYKNLIEQISAKDEKIKEVTIIFAIRGNKEERSEIIKAIKRNAELYQIKIDIPRMRQMNAWQSYDLTSKGMKDYEMFLPTLTLAASFPFAENYHNDSSGFLIGEDSSYGLPTFFDPFWLDKERTSHNIGITGTSGSGKSYLLKLMIVNEFSRGTKLFLFDIENELQKLTNRCGGEYIDLSNKSLINPLQVRYVLTDDEDASVLSKHLGFLETFFTTIFEDISEKEIVVLLDIVEKFYNTRNITKKTTLEEFEKMSPSDFPIFSDLYAFLLEQQRDNKNSELSSVFSNIEILLKRLTIGQDSSLFNGITTIDLSNSLVAFNLQELLFNSSRRLINTQMLNLLTYLSNEIVDNKKKNEKHGCEQKIMLIFDEFHNYIDEDNPTLLKYIDNLNRRARKYKTGVVVATQQPNDFTNRNDILRHASAIFNNSQYQITGMLKDSDIESIEKLYSNIPLTETQKSFLSKCQQGQFLLNITNKNRLRVNVFANPVQRYFMGESDECPIENLEQSN